MSEELSECGEKAQAFLNQYHRSGSNIFATQQADYDDIKAKVEQLRLKNPTMSELEPENEAFEKTMYHDEIPNHPLGYGLGVKKGDIYAVCGVLRKEGYGKVQRRNIVIDKEEMTALHKRNDVLEKDNAKNERLGPKD
ncbi:Capsid protein VP1 [Bienertia sinuspersici]